MADTKLANVYNSDEELQQQILEESGGGGGGGDVDKAYVDRMDAEERQRAMTKENQLEQKIDNEISRATTEENNIKNEKQDKLTTGSDLSSVSDSTKISVVDLVSKIITNFTLATLWNWVKTKFITTITSSSTDTEVASAKATYKLTKNKVDKIETTGKKIYSHDGSLQGELSLDTNLYSSSTDEQVPTSKIVYEKALKELQQTGNNAVSTTGLDSQLSRTSGSHQNTTSRVSKKNGIVYLQYFSQYTCGSAGIGNKFTCIGSVGDDYKPVAKTPLTITGWNSTPASASGYVDTDGKIYVWVSTINANTTNIQFIINATWKANS